MAISSKAKYGLTALIYIAVNETEKHGISAVEISASNNISLKYLEQILNVMRKDNIISASRGFYGGYKLAKSADKITLTEIMHSLDAIMYMTDNDCTGNVWEHINDFVCKKYDNIINDFTDGITLSDIVENYLKCSDEKEMLSPV